MRKRITLLSALTLMGGLTYTAIKQVEGKTIEQPSSDSETQAIVSAATIFLKTLSTDQRQKIMFPFTYQKTGTIAKFHRTSDGGVAPGAPGSDHQDTMHRPEKPASEPQSPQEQKRGPGTGPPGGFVGEQYGQAIWSNYPVSDVLRPGLRLGSLTTEQRAAAMHLLQTILSPMGYQKVLDIMGSDQALADAGTNFVSGETTYTIGIFGEPSISKPWMLQFGGHHLGLNIVVDGSEGAMTPTLTGAQPAVYKRKGETVRVLAKENDTAFAFLDSLNNNQRKQAILNYEVRDLVFGPGHAGETIQPESIKGSELSAGQRTLLLSVISQWAGIINDSYASARIAQIKADLGGTYFAWSGPTTHEPGKNGSSYYRIQGPRLVIEFSPQGVGGDPTMHVHTIYRDPTNDYGIKLTGAQ